MKTEEKLMARPCLSKQERVRHNQVRGAWLACGLALTATLFALSPAQAKDADFVVDTDAIGCSDNGVITSDQMLELGVPTSNGLRLEGEQSMRYGSLDR